MTPEYILKVLINSCTVGNLKDNGELFPTKVIENKKGDIRFYVYIDGHVTANRIERVTYTDMNDTVHVVRQRTFLVPVEDERLIKAINAFVGLEMLS